MWVTEDIVTIAELKSRAAAVARQMHETHRPVIVTQRGKAAMVLLTPGAYDRLVHERDIVAGLHQSISEANADLVTPHDEVMRTVREAVEQRFPKVGQARLGRESPETPPDA